MGEPVNVPLNFDFPSLVSRLGLGIERAVAMVNLGYTASLDPSQELRQWPGSGIVFSFSGVDEPDVEKRFRTWLVTCGFRDLIEDFVLFLDTVHDFAAHLSLVEKQKAGVQLIGQDYLDLTGRCQAFRQYGISKKLSCLQGEHGVAIDRNVQDEIESINAARNCLVHRGGVVGESDSRTISWRRLILVWTGKRERELQIGDVSAGGEGVGIKTVRESKTFALGERIAFLPIEFTGVGWGLFFAGQLFVNALQQKFVALGGMLHASEKPSSA